MLLLPSHESRGTQDLKKAALAIPAETENHRADFSSERAPHINKSVSLKIIKERRKFDSGFQMCA
jgi:hypothetical protein